MIFYEKIACDWLRSVYQVLLSQVTLDDLRNYNASQYSLKRSIKFTHEIMLQINEMSSYPTVTKLYSRDYRSYFFRVIVSISVWSLMLK